MDAALWSSVDELLDGGGIDDAQGVALPPALDGDLRTSFLDFGAYFDLSLTPPHLEAVPEQAQAAARDWLASRAGKAAPMESEPALFRITNLAGPDYAPAQLDCMRRWLDIEPDNYMAMSPATDAEFGRSVRLIGVAMDHLKAADAELWAETMTIIRDLFLSRPDGTNRINYGGASSFALWGALTINSETHVEWMQFYRQIVHEAAHNLLFGIARDEPLVNDDPKDRRASPIRADVRPMDGIFHAAYVSAREALAIDRLLCLHEKAGRMDAGDARILDDILQLSVLSFWDACQILRAEALLTGLGDAVLRDCEQWMSASFAIEDA
jgi:HEXXH motif-containing protein